MSTRSCMESVIEDRSLTWLFEITDRNIKCTDVKRIFLEFTARVWRRFFFFLVSISCLKDWSRITIEFILTHGGSGFPFMSCWHLQASADRKAVEKPYFLEIRLALWISLLIESPTTLTTSTRLFHETRISIQRSWGVMWEAQETYVPSVAQKFNLLSATSKLSDTWHFDWIISVSKFLEHRLSMIIRDSLRYNSGNQPYLPDDDDGVLKRDGRECQEKFVSRDSISITENHSPGPSTNLRSSTS